MLQASLSGGMAGSKTRILEASAPRTARDNPGRLSLANKDGLRARFPGPRRFPLWAGRGGGCRGERRIGGTEDVRFSGASAYARNEKHGDKAKEGQGSHAAQISHHAQIDPRRALRQGNPKVRTCLSMATPPIGSLGRSCESDHRRFLPESATAVLLVEDYDAPAMHSLLEIGRLFLGSFSQIAFAAVRAFGMTDANRQEEAARLKAFVEDSLARFLPVAELIKLKGAVRIAIGPDPVGLTIVACEEIARDCPEAVLFWTRPKIEPSKWHYRLLTNKAAEVVARVLFGQGWITLYITFPVTAAT